MTQLLTGTQFGEAHTEYYLPAPREVLVRPPFSERVFVVVAMLLYGLGLPTDWFTEPFDADLALGGTTNDSTGPLASVAFATIAGIAALIVLPRVELLVPVIRRNLPLVALVGWTIVSFLWSDDPFTTLRRALGLSFTAFFGLYLVLRFTRAQVLRLAAVSVSIGLVVHQAWIVALPQYGQSAGVEPKWSGVFTNKNTLGQFAVLAALVLVLHGLDRASSRIWAFPMCGLALAQLWFSESKTSLAAAVLLASLLVVFTAFRARRTLFGAVAASMTAASVAGFLFGIGALPLITRLLDKDITLTGRTQLWADIIARLDRRPFLGYGYEAFWNGWGSPAAEIWRLHTWTPPTAHNAPLDYLLQLGAIGLAIFLVFLVTSIVRAARLIRDVRGWAAMTPLLLVSFMLMFSVTESGVLERALPFLLIASFTGGMFLRPNPPATPTESRP